MKAIRSMVFEKVRHMLEIKSIGDPDIPVFSGACCFLPSEGIETVWLTEKGSSTEFKT